MGHLRQAANAQAQGKTPYEVAFLAGDGSQDSHNLEDTPLNRDLVGLVEGRMWTLGGERR